MKTLEPQLDRLLKMSARKIECELARAHPAKFRTIDVKRIYNDWKMVRFLLSKVYYD